MKPRRAETRRGFGVADAPLFLFAVHDLTHGIHRFTDAAADVAFGALGLTLGLQVPIPERLTGLLFDRAGRLLQAALDPLSINGILRSLRLLMKHKRSAIRRDTNSYNFACCYIASL